MECHVQDPRQQQVPLWSGTSARYGPIALWPLLTIEFLHAGSSPGSAVCFTVSFFSIFSHISSCCILWAYILLYPSLQDQTKLYFLKYNGVFGWLKHSSTTKKNWSEKNQGGGCKMTQKSTKLPWKRPRISRIPGEGTFERPLRGLPSNFSHFFHPRRAPSEWQHYFSNSTCEMAHLRNRPLTHITDHPYRPLVPDLW